MNGEPGLIHLYCGEGKGKTTAAMGLALRAAGRGFRVVIVQFLKNGDSGEMLAFRAFANVTAIAGKGLAAFSFAMTAAERDRCRALHDAHLEEAIALCEAGACDLLVLDEAIGACNRGLLDRGKLLDILRSGRGGAELVLTGRAPDAEITALADYITEMTCVRHPFHKGIAARTGIER